MNHGLSDSDDLSTDDADRPQREHRRKKSHRGTDGGGYRRRRRIHRLRRRGRRAYIRSVYFLPSLATLGNAVCGFAAMYVATLVSDPGPYRDVVTRFFHEHGFVAAAYWVLLAMVFDALDGRLARFARHTTDFGGQLDSLADVVSFGAVPAFIALRLMAYTWPDMDPYFSRLVWVTGAMYLSLAAVRLARFNVSNQHGEQYHFSFLGLPSPGAAGAVVCTVLMQQTLLHEGGLLARLAPIVAAILPVLVLATGLLMISQFRYPHLVNRYMRGKRSVGRLMLVLGILLLLLMKHQYTLGVGTIAYAAWGPAAWLTSRIRRRAGNPANSPALPTPASGTDVA